MTTMLLVVLPLLAASSPVVPDDDPVLRVEERVAEMKERLKLSDDQVVQIRPLVEERAAQTREIYAALGSDPTYARKRDAVQRALRLSDAFSAKVEALLTPEQQPEWKQLRADNRYRMRAALQARGKARP